MKARRELERSINHVCFAEWVDNASHSGWMAVADEGDAVMEFFTTHGGRLMWRARADCPTSAESGIREREQVVVCTGPAQVADACDRLKCEVPAAVTRSVVT